jgi:hypothetical protein
MEQQRAFRAALTHVSFERLRVPREMRERLNPRCSNDCGLSCKYAE